MKMLAKALIALPLILLMGRCTFEYFVVDACLDAGNVYDYAQGFCRSDVERMPQVPYIERSWLWLLAAVASIIVGIALLAISDRKAS